MSKSARPSVLLFAVFLSAAFVGLAADLPPEIAALRTKAENGNAIAEYNLGLAYMQGRDIPADFPEAFVWLSLARENGNTGKALEALLGQMTPPQFEEGQRRLAARRAGRGGSAPVASAAPPRPAPPAAPATDVTKLQDELKTLRATVARFEGAAGTQVPKEEMAGLQAQLKTALAANAELATKTRALEGDLAKSSRAAADATALNGSLAAEIERERAARTRAEQLLAQSRNAGDVDAKTRDDLARKRAAEDAANLVTLRQQMEVARAVVTKTESAARDVSAQKAAIEKSLAGVTAERDALAARVRQAESSARSGSEAEARIADLGQQLESTRRDLASAQRDLAAAQAAAKAGPEKPSSRAHVVETAGKFDDAGRGYVMVRSEAGSAPAPANAEAGEPAALRERVAALESERAALKQQLATAAAPVVLPPAAPAEAPESAELRRQLADIESKLENALRGYTLLQEENARLAAEAGRTTQNHAAATADARAKEEARSLELNERLRQTQAQLAEAATENAQLRTRIAVAGNAPGARYVAPTRPAPVAPETAPLPLAPPAPPTLRIHTVAAGETLSGISRQYYGTPDRWQEIYAANRDILREKNALSIGVALKIP